MIVLAFIYRVLAAKRTHRRGLIGDTEVDMKKFGPLKVVLRDIPALLADAARFTVIISCSEQPFDTIFRKALSWRTGLQTSFHVSPHRRNISISNSG